MMISVTIFVAESIRVISVLFQPEFENRNWNV